MAKKNKKIKVFLIVLAVLVAVGTIAILLYLRSKEKNKPKDESIVQSIQSAVSSVFKSSYEPASFPLRQGMSGEKVQILQTGLILLGHSVGTAGADGKFGESTLKAVRAYFQEPTKTEVTESQWKPFAQYVEVMNKK